MPRMSKCQLSSGSHRVWWVTSVLCLRGTTRASSVSPRPRPINKLPAGFSSPHHACREAQRPDEN